MNASYQKLLPLYTPESDNNTINFAVQPSPQILISEREYSELKWEVGFWRSLYNRAILREKKLKKTIKEQEDQIRDLKHRVFGKKSEKKSAGQDKGKLTYDKPKRPRGQQPGSKGHGRTKRPDLPEQEEEADFLQDPICQLCGKPYIADGYKEEEIINHQMTEDRFHNDESSWKVFENVEGKIGNRWWLWVSRSDSVVYFQIAPGRGANVPVEHFKNIQHKKIIIICDRYSAYKSMAKQLSFIILAFCWSHVRRDFLDAARKYPEIEHWALSWVGKIGELYHINNLRCKEFDKELPIQWQSMSFKDHHHKLVEKMDKMEKKRDAFIKTHNPDDLDSTLLSNVKYKILTSLTCDPCG